MHKKRTIYTTVKRVLDVFGAVILLILTSPIMFVTAILVRFKLGKPVIFSQPRPGLQEKVFNLYKFRTMKDVDESRGLITDEQRLTKFGKKLRSTSFDELPSLWNVLRGDMSFVGPRPLLVSYLGRYSAEESRRHEVKPGITGLAQASGRNLLSWDQKFKLDIQYVDKVSFRGDLHVIYLTVLSIFSRKGITSEGHATMPEFGIDQDVSNTGPQRSQ
jgi:lipopolysaccharide/colanic/teichoic acid biosynthesis glycosyltransferase